MMLLLAKVGRTVPVETASLAPSVADGHPTAPAQRPAGSGSALENVIRHRSVRSANSGTLIVHSSVITTNSVFSPVTAQWESIIFPDSDTFHWKAQTFRFTVRALATTTETTGACSPLFGSTLPKE
jgi:hypothetical protein